MYMALKHSHMLLAYLSIGLFVLRGVLVLVQSGWLQKAFFRIVPHVIDTLLLVAGLALMFLIQQYPGVDHWLTAKVVALVVYIVLGMVALRRGRGALVRAAAFFGAVAVFGYIYAVAITKNPLPVHFIAG